MALASFEGLLKQRVEDAIRQEIANLKQTFLKKAVLDFETELRKVVMGVTVKLGEFISVEPLAQNITIHIKMDKPSS